MIRYFVLLVALLCPVVALASPNFQIMSPSMNLGGYWTFPAGDTSDGKAMGVSGTCVARATIAGSDAVSLYQVPTATTATSSGTLVAAFTATSGTSRSFKPGNDYVRPVATTASTGGSKLEVICSNVDLAGGGAVNELTDTDGDGISDMVIVSGDYNGDGAVTPEDIDDASDALFAAAGSLPKTVAVQGGPYSMEGVTFDWGSALRGFIELNSNTTLVCAPGTVIEGFGTAAEYSSIGTTQVISHKTATSTDIGIYGCTLDSPVFQSGYDASGWNNENHFAFHLNSVTGLKIIGNTVKGAGHTCIYSRDSTDVEIRDNNFSYCGGMMEHGGDTSTLASGAAAKALTITLASGACTAWTCAVGDAIVLELDDGTWHQADVISVSTDTLEIRPVPPTAATSGNTVFRVDGTSLNNGVYIYSESNDSVGIRVVGNIGSFVGGTALHTRAASGSVAIRDLVYSNNVISDTVGDCVDIGSIRGGAFSNNVCNHTGGIYLVDGDGTGSPYNYCFDDSPNANCSDGVVIKDNSFRVSRWETPNGNGGAVKWGRGHSNVVFKGNVADGTIAGGCWNQYGNSPGSYISDNLIMNCAHEGFFDAAQAITAGLTFRNLTIKNVGRDDISDRTGNALRLTAAHQGLTFDGLSIEGCDGDCVVTAGTFATTGLTFRNFEINGIKSGFAGRITESEFANYTCDADTEQTWFMISNASSATDCDSSATTGSTENACYCTGSAWTDFGAPYAGFDAFNLAAVGTHTGTTFVGGTVRNIVSRDGIRMQGGSSTYTNPTVKDVHFTMGSPAIRTTDTMDDGLIIDAATVTGAVVAGLSCSSVTDCVDSTLDDSELGAHSFVTDDQTPNGTCAGGNVMVDSDGGTSATLYICEGASWVAK